MVKSVYGLISSLVYLVLNWFITIGFKTKFFEKNVITLLSISSHTVDPLYVFLHKLNVVKNI